MRKPFARTHALRALAEGAKATLDLLADASGRSLRMLKLQAEREGWALDRAPQEDLAARFRVFAAMLLDKLEDAGRKAAEEGITINKAEIDGFITIIRGLEKVDTIMRPEMVAKENKIKQDEDMAEVLQRINTRIVEMARELAAQLVEESCRAGRCVAGEGRMV
ncbi:hypothetical protein [Neomesorhizobium albiziae]|nr:hypothetical protein [Mesorhizobium albiziae]GLS32912.1 hypothetical protein GCM10007937_46220 [Mesorhizobium albiziae]